MSKSSLILAGWFIDGRGGPITRNMLLKIDNGRIETVDTAADHDLQQTEYIDLSHCTILPGLIDSHVHLIMSGTNDPTVREKQLNASFNDTKAVIQKHLHQHLANGIVAVRDGGDYGGYALKYKREYLPYEALPIHVKAAGKAWRAHGRYGRLIGRPPAPGESLDRAVANDGAGCDHIKIVNSGINSLKEFAQQTPPQFNLDQLTSAVHTAKGLGLKTMVHANGKLPVKLAITAGCHSIEHGFFMGNENLKRMADQQITWVPTAYTMKAYDESFPRDTRETIVAQKTLDHQMEQIQCAARQGVPMAAGTDCGSLGVHHGSALKEEIKIFMESGLTPAKTVQCATSNNARLLGLEKECGWLGPGAPAAFVVIPGDPDGLVNNLDNPESLFIQGKPWEPGGAKYANDH